MGSKVFTQAKRKLAAGEIDLNGDDIRVLLCMSNTTVDTEDNLIVFVAEFTTLDECDGANYARKALANEAVNADYDNSRAEFDADDVTWAALGAGTRQTIGALIYRHITNDDDSPVIGWIEFDNPITHDGTDFKIQWNAEGVLQFG